MLEQLLQIVKENAGDAIINNPAIPNEKNDLAIKSTTDSIFNALKKEAGGGNLQGITEMFKGGSIGASSPMINNISSNVINELMNKFNLDKGAASGIVSQLIPVVMKVFVNKTNDPGDKSIDLDGVLGSLTGGKGTGGILGKIFGNR